MRAMKKAKTTQYGVTGNHWRIAQLNMNYDRPDAVCTILLYVDEAARDAGAQPIDSFQVDLSSDFHDGTYSDGDDVMKNVSLKEAYKSLKRLAQAEEAKDEGNDALAFFADAEDV